MNSFIAVALLLPMAHVEDQVKLTLELEATEHRLGEPVFFRLDVTNIGDTALDIGRLSPRIFRIFIVAQDQVGNRTKAFTSPNDGVRVGGQGAVLAAGKTFHHFGYFCLPDKAVFGVDPQASENKRPWSNPSGKGIRITAVALARVDGQTQNEYAWSNRIRTEFLPPGSLKLRRLGEEPTERPESLGWSGVHFGQDFIHSDDAMRFVPKDNPGHWINDFAQLRCSCGAYATRRIRHPIRCMRTWCNTWPKCKRSNPGTPQSKSRILCTALRAKGGLNRPSKKLGKVGLIEHS